MEKVLLSFSRNDCVTQIKLNVFHLNCQRFEEDAVEASVMMIHTFNKDREKVKAAVDIISKWDDANSQYL